MQEASKNILFAVILSLAFPVSFIMIVLGLALPVVALVFYCWWVVKSELDSIREDSWRVTGQPSVADRFGSTVNIKEEASSPRYVHYSQPA